MKRRHARNWIIYIAILSMACVALCLSLTNANPVDANSIGAEGPERKAVITVSYTSYEWWLLAWSDSSVVCQVFVEHEGVPESGEVEYYCGSQVMNNWLNTPACSFSDEITKAEQCPGLYFHLANITPGERDVEVQLLPPEVFIEITGCVLQPPENRCDIQPELHFIGEEPLPNEQIINIQGYIGDESFSCEGGECSIPLPPTGEAGIPVVFWAESSFGDASETFNARVRVIPWGDFSAPDVETQDAPQWYVDILSSQYLGEISSTSSQIWSSFPPIGGPPLWLSSPEHPDELISDQPYYYLAGTLIRQGLVDASWCADGGLEFSGYANQCGMDAARGLITEWQNQFNNEIIQVAHDAGVPAQLLKNIFSRESQFWPGIAGDNDEAGLGHLSDLGADTVLLWNPNFFTQFCPLVLDTTRCQMGFGNLDIAEQEMLRGALVQEVNAACVDCPQGIDLRQANFSINIFARSLLANCEQVGQIIYNETQLLAGEVSSYEDLWRFTLVNYNGGPGCLSNAIENTLASNYPLTWESLILFLEPGACQASVGYVEDIAYMPGAAASAQSEQPLQPTPAVPTATPAPTEPPVESTQPAPTPTPTEPGYPAPPTQPTQPPYP